MIYQTGIAHLSLHTALKYDSSGRLEFGLGGWDEFEEVLMLADAAANWYHSNQYNAQSTCKHCGGVVRHEKWCITCDALVRYAYAAAQDPEKLTLRDRLILHALGVSWAPCGCEG